MVELWLSGCRTVGYRNIISSHMFIRCKAKVKWRLFDVIEHKIQVDNITSSPRVVLKLIKADKCNRAERHTKRHLPCTTLLSNWLQNGWGAYVRPLTNTAKFVPVCISGRFPAIGRGVKYTVGVTFYFPTYARKKIGELINAKWLKARGFAHTLHFCGSKFIPFCQFRSRDATTCQKPSPDRFCHAPFL